jgi:transcriptional regulator with XRE-family HTH domain
MFTDTLKKAVLFLKSSGVVRTHEEIAHATEISPSMLSGILNGTKKASPEWIHRFETTYNIYLDDPMTYTDLSSLQKLMHLEGKELSPDLFLNLYRAFSEGARLKDQLIESQRQYLNDLEAERAWLVQIMNTYEHAILQAAMSHGNLEDVVQIKERSKKK